MGKNNLSYKLENYVNRAKKKKSSLRLFFLTRSIRECETSIDFVHGPPGSRREWVKLFNVVQLNQLSI